MAASKDDLLMGVGRPGTATTLSAPGYTIGATTITVGSTTNWETDTGVAFAIDIAEIVDGEQVRVEGTYCEFVGTVTGATSITNVERVFGPAQDYPAGSLTRVYIPYSSERENRLVEWGLEEHKQDGSHSDITADSVVVSGNVTAGSFTIAGSGSNGGWEVGLPAPNTVTNNGNRSYDLVFNGTDLTDTVSEGMRLRTTRTVSAPTQCADLERDSSQYFSKTSPAGLSFTTTFTCSAWVKLESYVAGGIIARRNGTTEGWSFSVNASGQLSLAGLRIASNEKFLTSYQSIPLNKWVHVAACLDMTAGDTTAQKMWIDGVEVPRLYTLTGTATALVQGTTALVVGAGRSDGSNPFDGKIAQASVHSAILSDAQIKALMSQTISSSSPSIVSGFTLDGVLTDVSANANNLTAQGSALATNVDSPFGSYLGGTLDYGIITKTAFSTNTTLTVQVPEGCTIPTSGGVSAVSYSRQAVPYLFPRDSGRWRLSSLMRAGASTTSNASYGAYMSGGWALTTPVGPWEQGWQGLMTNGGTTRVTFNLSPTALTGLTLAQGHDASPLNASVQSAAASVSFDSAQVSIPTNNTTAQTYVMYSIGATTAAGISASAGLAEVFAEFNYL